MEAHLAGQLIPVVATMHRSSVSDDPVTGSEVTVKVREPDGTVTDIAEEDVTVDDTDNTYLTVTVLWMIPDDADRGVHEIEFDSSDPLVAAARTAIYVLPRRTVTAGS